MLINKITEGYVVQTYDTEAKRYISQSFTAKPAQVSYEDGTSAEAEPPSNAEMADFNFGPYAKAEPHLPFTMVQPVKPGEHVFNSDTGHCIRCNCDEDDAYVGGQECIDGESN